MKDQRPPNLVKNQRPPNSTKTSRSHFGEGDVSPCMQALRTITSRSSILSGMPAPARKIKENVTMKQIYFTGKSVSPSSKDMEKGLQNSPKVLRDDLSPLFRKKAFYKVLPESFSDTGSRLKRKDCKQVEEEVEAVDEDECFCLNSGWSSELKVDCEENDRVERSKNCVKVERSEQLSKEQSRTKDQPDQTELIMCPWKKMTIILLIFSLTLVTIWINSLIQMSSYSFDYVTYINRDVIPFLIGAPEEPKSVEQIPSFLERFRAVMVSRKGILGVLSKVDVIGVCALGVILFVLVP